MKSFIGAVIVCLAGCIIGRAVAQNDGPQAEGLQTLSDNRNTSLVGSCSVIGNNNLSCPVLGQSLAIDDQVYLQQIDLLVRTCGSSLWPIFILSNGSRITDAADNLQCNRTVPLGQLNLFFEVSVYRDSDNTTVIRTSVRVNESACYTTMFSSSDIPLSSQTPENCQQNGITPPPANCPSTETLPECPPLPTTPPTTPPTTTTNAGARGASVNHISLIAVFAAVVCLLLTLSQ